jgi:hypothetical protein
VTENTDPAGESDRAAPEPTGSDGPADQPTREQSATDRTAATPAVPDRPRAAAARTVTPPEEAVTGQGVAASSEQAAVEHVAAGQTAVGQVAPAQGVPEPEAPEQADRKLPPPLIAALALGIVLVVGIAVAGIVTDGSGTATPSPAAASAAAPATGPVPLVPVDAPKAGSTECTALLHGLPAVLANGPSPLHRRALAAPAPPASAAWGGTATQDPVVLRCGIERPPELSPSSELLNVSGVQWLRIAGDDAATWYAVDRPVSIALTLPGGVNTGPIQDISTAIGANVRAVPVF